jgi:hypothetical protein
MKGRGRLVEQLFNYGCDELGPQGGARGISRILAELGADPEKKQDTIALMLGVVTSVKVYDDWLVSCVGSECGMSLITV